MNTETKRRAALAITAFYIFLKLLIIYSCLKLAIGSAHAQYFGSFGGDGSALTNLRPTNTVIYDSVNGVEADFLNRILYRTSGGVERSTIDWQNGLLSTAPAASTPVNLDWINMLLIGPWTATNLTGTFTGNGAGLTNIPIAALPGITNFPAYAAGSIYTMTATPALLHFGTTDPSVTINQTGTYILIGGASFEYRGATYAATNAVTVKFRKTNGTAADVTSATRSCLLNVVTTLSGPAGYVSVPPVVFTATSGDVVQVWGSVQATPAAGSMACDSAEIVAFRIY